MVAPPCPCAGPGYATPADAARGPRERLIYVPAIVPDASRPDYLATVDVDEASPTYCQVISRLPLGEGGDELHHTGWNACSSCHSDASKQRRFLVVPAFKSGHVFIVDVSRPHTPTLHTVVRGPDIARAAGGLAYPHTSHCLADGRIMVSALGGAGDGGARGNFVLIDGATFQPVGTWAGEDAPFGYDFWYQPRFNTMVSSEFGAPREFFSGFDPSKVATDYGSKLHVYNWRERTLRQTIDLGADGLIPLELRFAHDPDKNWGFVGCALSSNVIRLVIGDGGKVATDVVIRQPWLKVNGWALPELPPLITDILVSLDDRLLFFSNWLRGDLCAYDISDPAAPKLAGRVWLGGSIAAGGGVGIADAAAAKELRLEGGPPPRPVVKGVTVQGGPQMIQLSLDRKRLYVTNSLLSPWDRQFYPDMVAKGSQLLRVDVGDDGSLSLNEGFVVDFGAEPGGPVLAHECRYPGGDCSSDIWV